MFDAQLEFLLSNQGTPKLTGLVAAPCSWPPVKRGMTLTLENLWFWFTGNWPPWFGVTSFETLQSFEQFSVLVDESFNLHSDNRQFRHVLLNLINSGNYGIVSALNIRVEGYTKSGHGKKKGHKPNYAKSPAPSLELLLAEASARFARSSASFVIEGIELRMATVLPPSGSMGVAALYISSSDVPISFPSTKGKVPRSRGAL